MTLLAEKRERLLQLLRAMPSCAVALSGGVDSAVVAKAAQLALGDRAVAVTGESASVAAGELAAAREVASLIGIRHEIIRTQEFANENYLRNDAQRCYHCKTELYSQMEQLASEVKARVLVNGVNADDLGDYRPGLKAASEHQIRSPLAECGIGKEEVRQLAAEWKLPVWDKPASPCLSSRVAYGEEVTPERLAMIDKAEQLLRSLGLSTCRVRYHKGDLARVEVPADAIARLAESAVRNQITTSFKQFGFRFITLDLEGFRSGSLNELLPLSSWEAGPARRSEG